MKIFLFGLFTRKSKVESADQVFQGEFRIPNVIRNAPLNLTEKAMDASSFVTFLLYYIDDVIATMLSDSVITPFPVILLDTSFSYKSRVFNFFNP